MAARTKGGPRNAPVDPFGRGGRHPPQVISRRTPQMRKLRYLAPFAAAAIALSGCASSTTPAPTSAPASTGASAAPATAAPVATVNLVLRYCWSGDGEVKAMQKIIDAWNGAHPEIKVRGISGSLKIEEIAAAAAGGPPPDMVIPCNNQAVPGFAHDGVILPMDDLIAQAKGDTSNIIPASLDWVKYQGKLYGLPFLQDDWGFAWNTDAFTAAGLDPAKPPTTLDELWTMAKALTIT